MNELSYVEWSGERLDPELLYLQHPIVRRFNFYLTDHRFRSREFALEKEPGITRVIALGGSSTWGLGIEPTSGQDYPTLLEGLLNRGEDGPRVEVINAAIPGAVGSRLLRWLRDGLLPFSPDIVVLSLTYNDAVILSASDEEEYFARITADDFQHPRFDDFGERFRQDRSREFASAIFQAFRAGEPLPPWPEDQGPTPPERFERVLRQFAELAAERGFRLVLVKEPISGGMGWIWKDEFYAAIERVGADFDLPVVDPTPALLEAGGAALFSDRIHPNARGHRVIAKVLEPVIRERLDEE